jgi:hypothetical protein
VASLLATAGLYADAATALAAMDYTATGITLKRVYFDAGGTAFSAIRQVCERCNYRFWFTAEGVPCFKPAPVVGEVTFAFGDPDDLRDVSDFQSLDEIKNRVTIEGAEQDIFNVTDQRSSSRLKGEAADATSIAAYLEKTDSITNQLFEDQGSLDDMCATILAASKDPKLYSNLTLFGNVVPLEVGQTIRWRVMLGANALDSLGVIRSISFSGKNATYKVEFVSATTSDAHETLVMRNAAFTHAVGALSLINIDAATMLAVSAASVALAASAPAVAAGAETDLYIEADAMAKTGEADTINAHWTEVGAMIVSTPDAGAGSTYVGLMLGAPGGGVANYIHSAHVADLVSGVAYTVALDYKYAVGDQSCVLRLYQLVGSALTPVGSARALAASTWTALSFSLTAIATAPLQMRFTFPATPSLEDDELRVDDISIKVT